MEATCHAELLEACRVLFGREFAPASLEFIREAGLRAAWRRRAFQTHPDRIVEQAAKRRHSDRFIEARRAYGVLLEHLVRRTQHGAPAAGRAPHSGGAGRPPARPRPPGDTARRVCDHLIAPAIPRRRLRLGEYLYHARVISLSTLVDALVWQRRQRDRFCEVGRRWGYLSETEMRLLLARRRPNEQIGATAQRLRLLTSFQVRTVLWFQQSRQQPLGSFFVLRGHLSPTALDSLLRRLHRHNASLSLG
ncbi:MAG TPA: hypothetical protein VN317_09820 [Candidatus Methanoperedens sp.]|nr:hypothetical protein [Candidatus Methanoperedens sp.]